MADILRPRVLAVACGYRDANDFDDLRQNAVFKLACGRLPEIGVDLTSQPTVSRWENAPDVRTLIRLSHGVVDLWSGVIADRPRPSPWISMTRPMSCTAICNCHYSDRRYELYQRTHEPAILAYSRVAIDRLRSGAAMSLFQALQ
jgi:Transposase DDE domain group 1